MKSVPLLQLLTVIGTEDAKTTKNKLRKKVKGQATLAEEISEVSKFLILSYTQNQKLGNLEKCSLLQILTVIVTVDEKTTKT